MPATARRDAKFCGKRCRQASHRFGVAPVAGRPSPADATGALRVAYADPPYPGKAHLYPEGREVDHRELVARLCDEFPDGWALSTSAEALQAVLALCPDDVRVSAWFRSARHVRSARAVSSWEPVILRGGRPLSTDVAQDLRDALVYEGRYRAFPGALIGMKPPEFSVWLFRQLGLTRGDELVDLYPGSGAVTVAWQRYTSPAADRDASRADPDATLALELGATRRADPGDASRLESRQITEAQHAA